LSKTLKKHLTFSKHPHNRDGRNYFPLLQDLG